MIKSEVKGLKSTNSEVVLIVVLKCDKRAIELHQKTSLLRFVREGADNSLNFFFTQNYCFNHNSFILSPPNLSF